MKIYFRVKERIGLFHVAMYDLTVFFAYRGWSDVTLGCCECSGDRSLHHTLKSLRAHAICFFILSLLVHQIRCAAEILDLWSNYNYVLSFSLWENSKLQLIKIAPRQKDLALSLSLSLWKGLFCSVGQGLLLKLLWHRPLLESLRKQIS